MFKETIVAKARAKRETFILLRQSSKPRVIKTFCINTVNGIKAFIRVSKDYGSNPE